MTAARSKPARREPVRGKSLVPLEVPAQQPYLDENHPQVNHRKLNHPDADQPPEADDSRVSQSRHRHWPHLASDRNPLLQAGEMKPVAEELYHWGESHLR